MTLPEDENAKGIVILFLINFVFEPKCRVEYVPSIPTGFGIAEVQNGYLLLSTYWQALGKQGLIEIIIQMRRPTTLGVAEFSCVSISYLISHISYLISHTAYLVSRIHLLTTWYLILTFSQSLTLISCILQLRGKGELLSSPPNLASVALKLFMPSYTN